MTSSISDGPLLDVTGLHTSFGSPKNPFRAVKDVGFSVRSGTITGIVGESGSGKSVSVKSVLGLVRGPGFVEAGRALFQSSQGEVDLISCSPRRRRDVLGTDIGYVMQNPFGALNPVLRIWIQFQRVLRCSVSLRGRASTELYQIARDSLSQVGIGDPDRVLNGFPHQLSGGMAQRVVIALALARKPRLIVADEPTTALDLTVQRQILDVLAARSADLGASVLLITHDLGVVAHYCRDAFVFYKGEVVEYGLVGDLFKRTQHPYTQRLIAASAGQKHSEMTNQKADPCPC
jgi:ABC-type dipeptide/oligopeptide/nickel transport system ATPase component